MLNNIKTDVGRTFIKKMILILLINNNFIFSQNIEKIKKSDTLYIYFESKNNTYDQVMDKKTYAFNYLNNFGHYNTLWFYVKSNSNILSLKRRRFFKKNKDVPFFVWLAFNAPHTPYHLPPLDLLKKQ